MGVCVCDSKFSPFPLFMILLYFFGFTDTPKDYVRVYFLTDHLLNMVMPDRLCILCSEIILSYFTKQKKYAKHSESN